MFCVCIFPFSLHPIILVYYKNNSYGCTSYDIIGHDFGLYWICLLELTFINADTQIYIRLRFHYLSFCLLNMHILVIHCSCFLRILLDNIISGYIDNIV